MFQAFFPRLERPAISIRLETVRLDHVDLLQGSERFFRVLVDTGTNTGTLGRSYRTIRIIQFGNGAERMLQNKQIDCSVHGLNFNIHTKAHMARAAQEGIVFAFKYGMDIMNEMGIDIQVIRAGNANLFLSPIFRDALAGVTGTVIELYDTKVR